MRGRDIPDLIRFVQSTAELGKNKAKQGIQKGQPKDTVLLY